MRVAEGASYIPVMNKLINMSLGPILELGCGSVSTSYLHWMCYPTKRRLVSYENNLEWFRFAREFRTDWHEVHYVEDWDKIDLSEPWSIALVDHSPAERRREEIKKLVHAEYVVAHDDSKIYQYSKIMHLFRYHYRFEANPNTLVLSRRRPFDNFTIGYDASPPPVDKIVPLSERYMIDAAGFVNRKRAYTICEALGEIYLQIDDPELKRKLRYAATLSQYVLWKLKEFSPQWLKDFYPKGKDYERIMNK